MVTKSTVKPAAVKKTAAKVKPPTQVAAAAKSETQAKAPLVKTGSATENKPVRVATKQSTPEPLKVKPKLIRDSFTMPKAEYTVIEVLKQRAAALAKPAKKSELLRAGVKALSTMTDKAFLAALKVVPTIKTGRPGKA